jgi:hypothetical protein
LSLTLPKDYNSEKKTEISTFSNNYRLVVDSSLLKRPVYEFEEITTKEDMENFDIIWKMAISPVQLGNRIEFLTKYENLAYEFPIEELKDVTCRNKYWQDNQTN